MRYKIADMQTKKQVAAYNDLQTKLQKSREEKEFKQKLVNVLEIQKQEENQSR